jgi:putative aminopeptidase FrvX
MAEMIGVVIRVWAVTALTIFSGSFISADSLELKLLDRPSIETRLKAGAVSAGDRQSAITKLFVESGCSTDDQPVNKHAANVICRLPGETNATIVVGAHMDFAEEGKGIVDDWSGTALLPSLYQVLKEGKRRHTFEFIAFTGEEKGLVGSNKFVKKLPPDEKTALRAFVNLECLGLTSPKVWVRRSTPDLVELLAQIAASLKIPVEGINVDQVGDDDTHPFLDKHIPVISVHSVTQQTWGILHSNRDNLDAINSDDYYNAYRLLAFYLAYLDGKLAA